MGVGSDYTGGELIFHDTNRLPLTKISGNVNSQTKSGAYTMTAADSGLITYVSATAVITLPATVVGYSFTFVNTGADGAVQISLSPAALDLISGIGLTAVDNKDVINTLATSKRGDSISIIGNGVDGWVITSAIGIWARQA